MHIVLAKPLRHHTKGLKGRKTTLRLAIIYISGNVFVSKSTLNGSDEVQAKILRIFCEL